MEGEAGTSGIGRGEETADPSTEERAWRWGERSEAGRKGGGAGGELYSQSLLSGGPDFPREHFRDSPLSLAHPAFLLQVRMDQATHQVPPGSRLKGRTPPEPHLYRHALIYDGSTYDFQLYDSVEAIRI